MICAKAYILLKQCEMIPCKNIGGTGMEYCTEIHQKQYETICLLLLQDVHVSLACRTDFQLK